jgi:pyruvate,water dikinase
MRYIRFFEEIGLGDLLLVGGKNASLGEIYRELRPQGIRIPNGFAVTADAYRAVLDHGNTRRELERALSGLDLDQVTDLAERGARAREILYGAGLPVAVEQEILEAYGHLREEYGPELTVAVRSSATAEDLPQASFAGQQETYLNIQGEPAVLESCRHCFASLFTDRAIHYRARQGYGQFDVALSIGIMKMVRSDLASSGVLFTLDTESGFREVVFITATWGLGETLVQGQVEPDEFYVFKPTFQQGHRAVLRRRQGGKQIKMVYAGSSGHSGTRIQETTEAERDGFCLTDEEIFVLTEYALRVEAHYSRKAGEDRPMDIEWAKDGLDGHLYLVQARPETVASRKPRQILEEFHLKQTGTLLVRGRAVGTRIATGSPRVIESMEDLAGFKPGDVLVSETTTPDWEPVMKRAAAIVTDRGGRTCHAAIIARELGIPAIVGTGEATTRLRDHTAITVSCAEGDDGVVYDGILPFEIRRTDLEAVPRPKTRIMVNLGNPDIAFQTSFLPNDGVGLARMEFIISSSIRAHPMALLHPDRVTDARDRAALASLVRGYDRPEDFFVERLAQGIGTIAAAFWPKPVVVRMSDFKSNEYASLLGGRSFEPTEENPMLGFRGASRYDHPAYREGFALECTAMRRVREDWGFENVILMIPFVRRLEEADQVLARMADLGLVRGQRGLRLYAMCEVPSNVILIDGFAKRFDGFSIGSNDLTQLTLGVDRDSAMVAFEYDERDPAVLETIRQAVLGCRRNGIHSGLCGQAPSDYPEMADFLIQQGIDSISLNPDTVVATTLRVLDLEKHMQAEQAG